jgi:hypothetical protein
LLFKSEKLIALTGKAKIKKLLYLKYYLFFNNPTYLELINNNIFAKRLIDNQNMQHGFNKVQYVPLAKFQKFQPID